MTRVSPRQGFDDLTRAGQLRRTRRVVDAMLREYAIGTDRRVTLVADSYNTIYRVRSQGDSFVVRIGPMDRVHAPGSAVAEAQWMDELAAAGLRVPRVVASRDGAVSTTVKVDGVPGARECMLLTWTSGHALSRPPTATDICDLGGLSARLHAVSADRDTLPQGVLDGRSALQFDLPNRFVDAPPVGREVLERAASRVQRALDRLWASAERPPRVQHGDLTPHNVLRSRAGLVPVDFQDLTWAHDQQDIANSMFGFRRFDQSGALARAFRTGYERVRPWPDLDEQRIQDLFAARRLAMVNLSLTLRKSGVDEYVAHHVASLRDYLDGSG